MKEAASQLEPAHASSLKQSFDTQGYVALRAFFSPAEAAELSREIQRYVKELVPRLPREHVFYEDKGQPDGGCADRGH